MTYDTIRDESIRIAIEEAQQLAEGIGEWHIDIDEDSAKLVFTARPDVMEDAECDAPWTEYGGHKIIDALEKLGYRQKEAWIEIFDRATYGGGTVPTYEDGVLLSRGAA